MKVSIVLVHYHAQEMIENAIKSITSQQSNTEWEFIITDNSQNFDPLNLELLGVNYKLFDLKSNSGFARGVNNGLKNASGDVIWIVNQDVYLAEIDIAEKILSSLDKLPAKTILGCKLLDDNNEFQQSVWIDNPGIFREWQRGAINCKINPNWQKKRSSKIALAHETSDYVFRINGAFLVFKKPNNINEMLFDEDFFLYSEDVEWAIRIKRHGWKFYHDSEIQINHIGSASSLNLKIKLNQIEIMEWLVVRKQKTKLYFKLYIKLIEFNKNFDLLLANKSGIELNMKSAKESLDNFKYLKNKYYKIIDEYKNELFFNVLNEYKNDKKNI